MMAGDQPGCTRNASSGKRAAVPGRVSPTRSATDNRNTRSAHFDLGSATREVRRKESVDQNGAGLSGACVPSVLGTTSLQADSRNGKDTWAIGGELYGTARVSRSRDDCHSGLACLLQNLLNNFRSLASA